MLNRELNQRPGESLKAWKFRVLLAMANEQYPKTSWNEVLDTLRLPYSKSFAISAATILKEYNDYANSLREDNENLDAVSRNELEKYEIKKETIKFRDQRRLLNQAIRESARYDKVKEDVISAARESIDDDYIDIISNREPVYETGDNEGVLLLSDWHAGMYTSNMINTFNEEILLDRVGQLLDDTITYGKLHKIKKLNIFCLGDMVNGLIHVTTRINSSENAVDQTKKVADILCCFISELAAVFPEVDIYFSRGNHERVSANPKESIDNESFFDFIPWMIEARLANYNNVTIVENTKDSEIIQTKICGHNIVAVHGHKDKVDKVIENMALMTKTIPDFVFMGHFHSALEKDNHGSTVIVNGCLCGTDDFALKIRRTGKPMQKFIVFNNEGRLCTYNIYLK